MKYIRFSIAFIVCIIALLLPYTWRLYYFQIISFIVHLPFRAFGKVASYILRSTDTDNPFDSNQRDQHV